MDASQLLEEELGYEQGNFSERYDILEVLGGGGQATVYKVKSLETGETLAARVVSFPDQRSWNNLTENQRDAEILQQLDSPHIPHSYETGFDINERGVLEWYHIQEYVEGETLAQKRDRGWRPSLDEYVNIRNQILAGSKDAHQKGIIHRNITPENVIIDKKDHVTIVDFGIAKMQGMATVGKTFAGTIGYMAPEQFDSEKITRAVDYYGCDATLVSIALGENLTVPPHPFHDLREEAREIRGWSDDKKYQALWDEVITSLDPDPEKRVGKRIEGGLEDKVNEELAIGLEENYGLLQSPLTLGTGGVFLGLSAAFLIGADLVSGGYVSDLVQYFDMDKQTVEYLLPGLAGILAAIGMVAGYNANKIVKKGWNYSKELFAHHGKKLGGITGGLAGIALGTAATMVPELREYYHEIGNIISYPVTGLAAFSAIISLGVIGNYLGRSIGTKLKEKCGGQDNDENLISPYVLLTTITGFSCIALIGSNMFSSTEISDTAKTILQSSAIFLTTYTMANFFYGGIEGVRAQENDSEEKVEDSNKTTLEQAVTNETVFAEDAFDQPEEVRETVPVEQK